MCLETSFRWRHRFLEATRDKRPSVVTGILEADETFILESAKVGAFETFGCHVRANPLAGGALAIQPGDARAHYDLAKEQARSDTNNVVSA